MKQEQFLRAPSYKASPYDDKRMQNRKKVELKKEELKFKKEFGENYYDSLLAE